MNFRLRHGNAVLALLLVFSLLLSGCSPSGTEDGSAASETDLRKEEIAAANANAAGLSFEEAVAIAAKNHEPYTVPNDLYAHDMKQYYHADSGLLTEEEIHALREHRKKGGVLSKEEAMEDADLFFRTWKYAYAGYYMMGEELFLSARSQVMEELEGLNGGISSQSLADLLYDSMKFLQDAHSTIDGKAPASYEHSMKYLYFYDNSLVFSRDELGYYITLDDGKWYYSGSSTDGLRIEPTLLEDGRTVYCPMLLIPSADAHSADTVTLVKGEDTLEAKLRWRVASDVSGKDAAEGQCHTVSLDDIYYIDYLDMDSSNGDVNDFLKTAYEARKHKVVIFDLRHTLGWEHWQLLQWIEIFSGEYPAINETAIARNNALRTLANYGGFKLVDPGEEELYLKSNQGKLIKNHIPVIILTDKSVLSSIEASLTNLKTLENSIVIGGNTLGCHLGGSVQEYYLPHSGVSFGISGFNEFYGDLRNIDGIGFEPDLWCEPESALRAALNLLADSGRIDSESATAIKEKIEGTDVAAEEEQAESQGEQEPEEPAESEGELKPVKQETSAPADLKVVWFDHEILPMQCFGDITYGGDYIKVTAGGKMISDFTVVSGDEAYLSVEKSKYGGNVLLKKVKSYQGNDYPFTITYEGTDYTFYTND